MKSVSETMAQVPPGGNRIHVLFIDDWKLDKRIAIDMRGLDHLGDFVRERWIFHTWVVERVLAGNSDNFAQGEGLLGHVEFGKRKSTGRDCYSGETRPGGAAYSKRSVGSLGSP